MKNTEKILTKGGKLSNYNYEPRVFFALFGILFAIPPAIAITGLEWIVTQTSGTAFDSDVLMYSFLISFAVIWGIMALVLFVIPTSWFLTINQLLGIVDHSPKSATAETADIDNDNQDKEHTHDTRV